MRWQRRSGTTTVLFVLSQDGVAGPKGEKGEPGTYNDITADNIAKLILKLTAKVTLYFVYGARNILKAIYIIFCFLLVLKQALPSVQH